MGMDVQNIMMADEYRAMFSTRLKSGVVANRWQRKVKETNLEFGVVNGTGYYIGAGVGGPITGRGFSLGIIDDPCKNRAEAESPTWRDNVWKWYTSTFRTRAEGAMSSGGVDRIVVCATPWHEDDLVGRILASASETGEVWHVIRFPAVFDGEDAGAYNSTDDVDQRGIGEALWPERINADALDKVKKLSSNDWTSLWQCRPAAAKGNIFKRADWKYYETLPDGHFVYSFSLDCAFKGGENSSYVVLQLWASQGPNHYLVNQWRDRMDYTQTKALCRAKFAQYPHAMTKVIEDKANGPAIIDELKREFSGLVAVTPRGSKEARALAISGMVEAGNIFLPLHESWVPAFIDETAAFPSGANDDQVDAMTQYLERSSVSSMDFLTAMGLMG
jgi:predicted phage terminase large subunit-like protein